MIPGGKSCFRGEDFSSSVGSVRVNNPDSIRNNPNFAITIQSLTTRRGRKHLLTYRGLFAAYISTVFAYISTVFAYISIVYRSVERISLCILPFVKNPVSVAA